MDINLTCFSSGNETAVFIGMSKNVKKVENKHACHFIPLFFGTTLLNLLDS